MKHLYLYLAIAIFSVANIAQAQDDNVVEQRHGDIMLSDEAVQFKYITTGDRFGVPNTDGSISIFLSEERDVVLNAGVMMDTQLLDFINWDRLTLRLGAQGYGMLLGNEDTDIVAFSGGGELRFLLFPRKQVVITAYGYYAPDIFTFGSADNIHDIGAYIEAPVTDRLTGYAGFRDFDVELLEDATQLQSSIILGVRYQFE